MNDVFVKTGTSAAAVVAAPGGDADDARPSTRDRILDALIHHVSEVGMRKLTMDDIAQRAELSRVTLYTYFPNKQAIVRAAVLRELERFFAELETVSVGYDDPGQRLVETFAHAYRYLRGHPL